MGSAAGATRTAARRLGLSEADYLARLTAGEKWCGAHRAWHSRNAFGVDRSRNDGLASKCREAGERTSGPTKRIRRQQRAAGLSWCRHCCAWMPVADVRSGLCREHTRAEARRIYAAGGYRAKRHVSAARRRTVAALGPDTQDLLLEATRGLCAYGCGQPATSFDHVIPVRLGGQTVPGNVVPACRSCNSRKKASPPDEWFLRLTDDARDLVAPGLVYDGAVVDWSDRVA